MPPSQTTIATKPLSATNPFGRRLAGKREWKMNLYGVLESEDRSLQILRSISNRHPHDAETQRLCGQAFEEAATRSFRLIELLQYGDKEEKEPHGNRNGGEA